jgi:integrase
MVGVLAGNDMKPRGKHPDKALTAVRIRSLSKPGRYADGGGLYLVVDDSGAKRWSLRVVVQGRRRELGLGGLSVVSLAEARDKAVEYRKLARAGGDPLAEKRKSSRVVPTFEAAARSVHAEHAKGWRSGKHESEWLKTLEQHSFPVIGSRRVDQIETADILRILAPIWLSKAVTARRVRQRIRTVLDWAKAAGYRAGENPVDGVRRGLPKQPARSRHHAALPYGEVPGFVRSLVESDGSEISKLAFEFLILTAARTGEALGARRSEMDLSRNVWVIPPERMKSGREHRVPLSLRAAEIVSRAMELSPGSEFVFASPRFVNRSLSSSMTLLVQLQRMGVVATVHGFRSAFRDWCSETTGFPSEVAEMALAHGIRDKTEAAYRRGDLFEKRRQLMNAWAGFVAGDQGRVVRLSTRLSQ